jgi:hypothetical protein
MNNNLIIFGDSFSTHFTTDGSVKIEESWPELLSKKLELNLINHSLIGCCNGEIINKFFKEYETITDGDIVIVGIGFYHRILDHFKNTTIHLGDDSRFNTIENTFFEFKSLDMDEYIRQDLIKFEFIAHYLTNRNVKFYIWSLDAELDSATERYAYSQFNEQFAKKYKSNMITFNGRYSLMDEIIENNSSFWVTNSDKHLNKIGHEFFFQYLYDVIMGKPLKYTKKLI